MIEPERASVRPDKSWELLHDRLRLPLLLQLYPSRILTQKVELFLRKMTNWCTEQFGKWLCQRALAEQR
jgi:hypothetical protein